MSFWKVDISRKRVWDFFRKLEISEIFWTPLLKCQENGFVKVRILQSIRYLMIFGLKKRYSCLSNFFRISDLFWRRRRRCRKFHRVGWVTRYPLREEGVRVHFWFWNVFKRNPNFSILFFTQIKMSSKQYLKARYSLSFLNCYKSDTKQDVIKIDILIHDNSNVLIS